MSHSEYELLTQPRSEEIWIWKVRWPVGLMVAGTILTALGLAAIRPALNSMNTI